MSRSPDHPTSAWTARQLRNAFPNEECPAYLLHDRDGAFTGIGGGVVKLFARLSAQGRADHGREFGQKLTLRRQTPSSPRRSPIPANALA